MDRRKKYKNFMFLNISDDSANPIWARETKATDFAVAYNPQTESYDYIADELPTTETTGFKPVIKQTLYAYIGEPIYDFLIKKARHFARGNEAMGECLLVYQDTDENGNNYADLFDVSFDWDTDDMVAGTLGYNINLNETPTHGTATIKEETGDDGKQKWTPVFTPDSTDDTDSDTAAVKVNTTKSKSTTTTTGTTSGTQTADTNK